MYEYDNDVIVFNRTNKENNRFPVKCMLLTSTKNETRYLRVAKDQNEDNYSDYFFRVRCKVTRLGNEKRGIALFEKCRSATHDRVF